MVNKSEFGKKIFYFAVVLFLALCQIIFVAKKPESLINIRSNLIQIYSPFVKAASFIFYPFTPKQNTSETQAAKGKISNNLLEIILEREELINVSFKKFKQITNNLDFIKFDLLFITPNYYSTNFLTDVVFAKLKQDDKSIKQNMLILSENGLFGRVALNDDGFISIVSMFDERSRIPVKTKKSNVFGLALGNGFELEFIHPSTITEKIEEGEAVLTSNENNLTLEGIPVGKIIKKDDKFKIETFTQKRPQILGIIITK
jgi:hypothetical protein